MREPGCRKTSNILLLIIAKIQLHTPFMKRDDTLWKSILEDIFEDFLLFFYPDAGTFFDFSKDFEYLDKELEQLFPPEDNSYQTRFVDKLVKVHCMNGCDEWILVHIEVQGYHDAHFGRRMFTYYSRILDKYDKPITAFAIFTENNAAFKPCEYHREFMGTSVLYRFNSFKILEQDEQMLRESDNPFAIVILTVKAALKSKQITENELLNLKIDLTKNLLSRKLPKSKIRKILFFLRFYIRFEKRETDVKFEKTVDQITKGKQTMGIEEFIMNRIKEEVRAEVKDETVAGIAKNLLKETSFTIEEIARLVGVSPEFVQKLKGNRRRPRPSALG
jgi:predicted transposase YdaD